MVATVDAGGLATGVNDGNTTIVALMTSPVGGYVVATTAKFVQDRLDPGIVNLPTLTVYKVGPGTGRVKSVPPPIDCGTGSACTGHFIKDSKVQLTAIPDEGWEFGGWSANCIVPNPGAPPKDQTTCSITMNDNDTVGAIFNPKEP